MSQASSPTHRSNGSLAVSSAKTMKLATRISSMDLTAWKACRSCSAASLSMCPDSLARKADAGWISSERCRSSSVTGCWASQCTSRPGLSLRSSSAMARSRRAWPSPMGEET